jgi:hypothetical protein
MKISSIFYSIVLIFAINGVALATCQDIISRCQENYRLDKAYCYNSGKQGQELNDCVSRAAEQLKYCISSTGC